MGQRAHLNQARLNLLFIIVILFLNEIYCKTESIQDVGGPLESTTFQRISLAYDDDGDEKNKGIVDEYLAKAVVEEKIRADWNILKKSRPRVFTETGVNKNVIKFSKRSDRLALSGVFHFLQFFPLLLDSNNEVVRISLARRVSINLQFKNKVDGTFTVYYLVKKPIEHQDLSDAKLVSDVLNKAFPSDKDKREFADLVKEMYSSKMNSIEDVVGDVRKKKLAVIFLTVTSVLKKEFSRVGPDAYWLAEIDLELEPTRAALFENTNREIRNDNTTRIRYELTASMLTRVQDEKTKWESLHRPIVIESDLITTINTPEDTTLRGMFHILQSFDDLYSDAGTKKIKFALPIGGSNKVFYLSKSIFGINQIFVNTKDSDWPGSTKRSRYTSGYWGPDYNTMVDELKDFPNQRRLAQLMIEACKSNLNINNQPIFSEALKIPMDEEKTANMIRHSVEFLVITMVAEAATPTEATKAKFIELMANTINKTGHFPGQLEMPELGYLGKGLKSGRSPTADDLALKLLYRMRDEGIGINEAFSDANYPIRMKGGTELGREYLYDHGDNKIPSYLIPKLARGIAQKAVRSYTTPN